MQITIQPQLVFIQSNILFIHDSYLNEHIQDLIPRESEMFSITLPTLWELRNTTDTETLFLHLEWPKLGMISVRFDDAQLNIIMEDPSFDTLGILTSFDNKLGDIKQVVFIPEIEEGLAPLLK